ncbi:hypothetical protein SDC9_125223 [bioreactor metagenome]|uniref:Uncharacterized protein n=1 Tax=bioreactor metagenome TaxID=1076179 RepID=A0A645CN67_9ZZZZ
MDRGHQLPIGVKGDLRQPGISLAGLLLVKAELFPQTHQGRLRGIAHLAVFVDRGVAAKQGRPQQRLLHRVAEVGLLHRDDSPGGIDLLDGHLVLGQRAGLIGADDGHAP